MYLEKLEIQGFKSFATKNVLVFPGMLGKDKRGITTIVGPNGSGKSNVADAIRWALGEQSMKTLRGKKAEDIIFSGSDKKGKLGMAEVSLFLNNESRQAPIDYSQIIITRRLYRNGDSGYMINNNRVRLSDIQILLAKANFGQKTYSVIGQGVVEGFLNFSITERKEFFDEATGVKQYQIKRDASLNKLRGALENLNQVEMLTSEIEPRLKSLTRQVDKIRKRGELEKELDEIQIKYYRKVWHEINDKLKKSNKEYLDLEKEKFSKDQKIFGLNKELDGIKQEKTVTEEFDALQENLSKLQYRKNELHDQLQKMESWIEIKNEKIEEVDTKELENKKDELLKLSLETENKIKSQEETDKNRAILGRMEQELYKLKNEKDDLIRETNRLNAWLEMKLESMGQFDLSFLNNRTQEIKKELSRNKEEREKFDGDILKQKNNLERLKREKEETIELVRKFRGELNEINSWGSKKIITEVNDRLKNSLDQLILAERETDLEKIKKNLLNIKDELKKVLAFASGEEAQKKQEKLTEELTRITEKQETVIENINIIELEKNTKTERVRLLAEKEQRLIRELNEIENKISKSQEKFDSGSVRKEIEILEEKIKPIEAKEEQIKSEIKKSESQIEESRNNIFELQRRLQSYNHEINNINNKLNDYRLNSAKHETRLEDIENSIRRSGFEGKIIISTIKELKEKCEEEVRNIDTESQKDREKLNKFNEEQEKKRSHLLSLQKNLQNLQEEINILNINLNEIKINSTRYETRLEDMEAEIRESFENIKRIKEKRHEGELDKEKTMERIKQVKKQLDMIGGIDPEVEKEYSETKERFDFLSGQSKDLNETIFSLKGVVKELDETIKVKFDKEFKVISGNFEKYFKILFNGGTAKIIKVMEEDVAKSEQEQEEKVAKEKTEGLANMRRIKFLQKHNATGLAGIEIQATPPGKKIASITMLSGGERALTAIALICAIISANPSPFVVLDEVDAALDEANSERLAKILEELSHKTQFIAITHNRATMRRSAILYGVTMGDDGVSKLLSVKLEDIKAR
ncbi:hypothetical protein A2331_01220 [Candidatus Falkowbacteria bacterium RIFOXYB2_FULL_34_18]|uniref:Chromosome partition protein Smc n=1 Tax=Candidatus Falkowbacteria bacterium RIFOXYD2_FULL_34_120 TaxID=1798007 RepID=A0A1F5TPV6_9BACT|nr:MAG: hypothetical protein A2331_01220 [Candidatus Falkowbacteria bacterium RIFOXYB2_FULL_34_18]OGF29135.1 MAG: hypothetical protein A2500_02830 [Candidatus Falkowbacteria bacterium RIFOXYC12_FULL_34_55]OGF36231.1 MAG: hypothetical protein A2466_05000 [Candidatus Falkowbacteria bacterium RIFOXYC2_FULL_34_220]OGF38645.1 MAG: hypothetical protein A2515_06960 [Candidatus Falkowbacteria bacterium RIFOXYD12_FULL_34_57]OGF40834.1 MAG: hypothetical protein A2531_06665 [Candidatus Falkowbacteria bact